MSGGRRSGPAPLEGNGIMNLAYGYIAQTLQTHDELTAARINEQRRIAADRRADEDERADGRHSALRGLGGQVHRRGVRGARGARSARGARNVHGLRTAH